MDDLEKLDRLKHSAGRAMGFIRRVVENCTKKHYKKVLSNELREIERQHCELVNDEHRKTERQRLRDYAIFEKRLVWLAFGEVNQ